MTRAPFYVLGLTTLAQSVQNSHNASDGPPFDWDKTKHVQVQHPASNLLANPRPSIAFGDSYSYTQGTAGLPNYSFIGSYLPNSFSFPPSTLLNNAIVQNLTGTAEGGPNWLEYLTGCGLAPLTKPSTCTLPLWNFAFAGADVTAAYLPLHHNFTIPMVNQTQQYLTWADPVLSPTMDKSRTLVSIWIGTNDLNDGVRLTPNADTDLHTLITNITATIFDQTVQPMYTAGYRHFLLLTLPPLDRTAANQKLTNPRPNATEIGWWDASLATQLGEFAKGHPSATMMLYDANLFLNRVLDAPGEYGIRNTTGWCAGWNQEGVLTAPEDYGCLPLDEYFWYNSGHMTSHTHKIMVPDLLTYLRSQSR